MKGLNFYKSLSLVFLAVTITVWKVKIININELKNNNSCSVIELKSKKCPRGADRCHRRKTTGLEDFHDENQKFTRPMA